MVARSITRNSAALASKNERNPSASAVAASPLPQSGSVTSERSSSLPLLTMSSINDSTAASTSAKYW